MKISNSKKELARIISDNGGWREGHAYAWFGKKTNSGYFAATRPQFNKNKGTMDVWGPVEKFACPLIKTWHQAILSRAEFLHLYPAPDADGCIKRDENGIISIEYNKDKQEVVAPGELDANGWIEWNGGEAKLAELVAACEALGAALSAAGVEPESDVAKDDAEAKPTIEQLATDYRNAKDYAERKQQEADAAKADADEKLRVLEIAGEALGLLVSPITEKQEPELVISDWRDLLVGDIVWVDAYDDHDEGEWPVNQMERASYDCGYAFSVKNGESCERWVDATKPWRFIRRP